ncbi:MAG: hypothetical protein FWC00_03465, partial [Firmicutes bacterium]|nr:hypothetical protein [Bacillota bacterium]
MSRLKLTAITLSIFALLGILGFMIYSTVRTIQSFGASPDDCANCEIVTNENDRLTALLESYRAKIDRLNYDHAELMSIFESDIENLKRVHSQTIATMETAHAQAITVKENLVAHIQGEIVNLQDVTNAEILDLMSQVTDLNTTIATQGFHIGNLTSINQNLSQRVANYQAIIVGLQSEIAVHELRQEQGELIINSLGSQVGVLNVQLMQVKALNNNLASQFYGLQEIVTILEQVIENHYLQGGESAELVQTLTAQVSNLNSQLVALNAQIAIGNGTIDALTLQIENLQGVVDNLQTIISDNQSHIADMESSIASLTGQVTALELQVNQLNTQIENAEYTIFNLEISVFNYSNFVAVLQNQIQGWTDLRDNLQAQIATMNGTVTGLENQIVTLQGQVTNYRNLANAQRFSVVFLHGENVMGQQVIASGGFVSPVIEPDAPRFVGWGLLGQTGTVNI